MKTPRRAVEFEIIEWTIEEKGFTNPPYMGRFELLWPRPGIENAKTILPFPDRIGETVDWSDASLSKKYLFKEDIQGRFVLTVSVLPIASDDASSAGSEISDLLGRAIEGKSSLNLGTLRDLLDLGGSVASYILSGPQKTIAQGEVTVTEQKSQTLTIPLEAPVDLKNPKPDPTPEVHSPGDKHKEILKESGDPNGSMTVEMTVWED